MNCPYCASMTIRKCVRKTKLGYTTFFCSKSRSIFNERTGTPFKYLEFPTDIVLLVVIWRLRYKLSLRDLAEMFLSRGFTFTHETVRDWESRFAPLLISQLRTKRRGQAGKSWHVDETYGYAFEGNGAISIRRLILRAIGRDSRLSEKRDMDAAQEFFRQAIAVVGHARRARYDGWASVLPTCSTRNNGVIHRTNVYLNNRIEQNHRGIKQRYSPMRGFGTFASAARECSCI